MEEEDELVSAERVVKKRRTRAEMEALRQDKADQGPKVGDIKVIDAIAALAVHKVDPGDYSDIYNLMEECNRIISDYRLSDQRFMELVNIFKGVAR